MDFQAEAFGFAFLFQPFTTFYKIPLRRMQKLVSREIKCNEHYASERAALTRPTRRHRRSARFGARDARASPYQRWLEAQSRMSGCQTEEDHNEEELAIESKLATLVSESVHEFPVCRNSRRARRNEIVMPRNSYEGLRPSRRRRLASRAHGRYGAQRPSECYSTFSTLWAS